MRAMSLQRAREAAAGGDWQAGYELLMKADSDTLLGPADLPLLAEVAYAAGHLDVTIEAWERAHALGVEAGDPVAAAGAAVRVAMHLLLDTALMAPVRGWLARAEHLLEGQLQTPAHAWLAVVRTYERMLTGDVQGARKWSERAIEVGSKHDAAAAAVGRVAGARLRILDGDVAGGLALLDEVGVAAVSGGLDALSTGIVYCELVCALQGLAQYDVAEQWTDAMERWCRTNAIGSLHGRCRVHRAEILRLRGACDEAEREALVACEELRPYLRREMGWPLSELGRIRLRKGDIDGAEEALLGAHRVGWEPQPGLALVSLARGDFAAAAGAIRDALEHPSRVPSKERPPDTELQRAPLLDAQVEIEIAGGDLDRARAAAGELERVAARFQSKALVAGATLARGRVRLAEGDAADAERRCSEAARLWNEIGAPYEAAIARMVHAEALRAGGREEHAVLELQAARAVLEQMEVATTAIAETNVFRREGDYWSVIFEGRTVRVRDLKGMRYLAQLLTDPGREFHVLDLVAVETGQKTALGDAGEVLDERAKSAYRRRLTEIEDDIEQARALEDAEREAQADSERAFLVRELARAIGLGGRDRRAASDSERARSGVTRAVRQAIARIGEHNPHLGEHLDRAVHTGTRCAYVPDPGAPAAWTS
jgi:tetratricopeptide (TPR) repeat protein